MSDETHHQRIDLYPGDLCLEDVPAVFSLEHVPADRSVGDDGGIWATLDTIEIGGLVLTRTDVRLMIGVIKLYEIEKTVSDDLTLAQTMPYAAE